MPERKCTFQYWCRVNTGGGTTYAWVHETGKVLINLLTQHQPERVLKMLLFQIFFKLKRNTITIIWPRIFVFSSDFVFPFVLIKLIQDWGHRQTFNHTYFSHRPLVKTIPEIQLFHSYCIFIWNETSRDWADGAS